MNIINQYNLWSTNDFFDQETRMELHNLDVIKDKDEIEDRFCKHLSFGTGGVRGIMGAGVNRINKYTIGRITTGLGLYIKNNFSAYEHFHRGLVIAYDTRNNSEFFATIAANILTAMKIKVLFFSAPVPTPELSFAIRHFKCVAGIVITASHNSKDYNGYKIYDEHGCQIVPKQVEDVCMFIDKINNYDKLDFNSGNEELKIKIDISNIYVDEVIKQSRLRDTLAKENLKIVYTPLHGTGNIPIRKVLAKCGFKHVLVVMEQEQPNGEFPTILYPNPEDPKALTLGLKLAEKKEYDIVLGTDPDSDRVGVAVRTKDGRYKLLTGNQIGALLIDFLLSHTRLNDLNNPAIINTVVTSELGAIIAKQYGCIVFSTLTGFKYIGEKITEFERSGDYTFVFGYEESYGYLAGTHARDKDAVVASLLISEMAAEYKQQGKTLEDKLEELYERYGYYNDFLESFTLKCKNGAEIILSIMEKLRSSDITFANTAKIIDFSKSVELEKGQGLLPASNVIKYIFDDDSWVAIRPSGTEPKLKVYYSIKANSKELAEAKLTNVRKMVKKIIFDQPKEVIECI